MKFHHFNLRPEEKKIRVHPVGLLPDGSYQVGPFIEIPSSKEFSIRECQVMSLQNVFIWNQDEYKWNKD